MLTTNVLEAFCEIGKETNTETTRPELFTSSTAPSVRRYAGLGDVVDFMASVQMGDHMIPSLTGEVAGPVGLNVLVVLRGFS